MSSVLSNPVVNDATSVVVSSAAVSGGAVGALSPQISLSSAKPRTVGSGPNQVDREYAIDGTVTDGTPFTINLTSGNDNLGNALAIVHVSRIHAWHRGSTGTIVVGAGTHPVMGTDKGTLAPGDSCIRDKAGFGYVVTSGAVSGVAPVEALPVVDTSGSGTFTITYCGLTTASITYSATIATLITNINTQLDATFGTGSLVASGASLVALIITGSASTYQYNAFGGHFVTTITGTGFTFNGSATIGTSTTTTAGVAVISAQSDTLTITADVGVVPFSLVIFGRSA